MPLIDSLLAMLRPRGVERVVYGADHGRASVEGKSIAQLYAEQPHLRTVVDFLAQNVAQLTPKCYIRRADADRERDTAGALPLLLADPNPDMTGWDLVYALAADYLLYGRAIWLVGRDAQSRSGWQIRPIPPAWVTSWEGGDGFSYRRISFRDLDSGGGTVEVDTSQCVMFTAYRPGSPARALSPVESLKQTLAEQVEAQAYRRSVWGNATRISGYISRPAGTPWSDGAAKRFKDDMRENWSKGGANAGRTPVLEDGMRYEPVTFNPHEGDWTSGVKLSREDVAAAYHVNPAMIWPGSGQTYASAKDNARALYADTLMPLLTMIQRRLTKSLGPMVGAPAEEYVEFDIRAKLQGSFEEQATALQSAVGGPWMTRQEARGMMNMPAEPEGDLITPLNVLVGGLASPNDTAPKVTPLYAPVSLDSGKGRAAAGHGGGCSCKACSTLKAGPRPRGRHTKAEPTEDEEEGLAETLRSFYARQRKSVLSAMGAKSGRKADGAPEWWDSARWDRELADDLMGAILANATAAAKRALEQLGIDPSEYDEPRTRNYLRAWAESRARGINAATLAQLEAALAGDLSDAAEGSTPAGVFDKAETSRAAMQATTLATQVASWGTIEAARQCAPDGAVKTWRTNPSRSPRSSHARLAGETVPIDEPFSNGAYWPGDSIHLPVSEVANCHCEAEVTVKDEAEIPEWDPEEDVSSYTADNLDVSGLSGKELKRMKSDKPEEWKGYVRLSQLGYDQKLLHEEKGASANIDLLMVVDGEAGYWDLKTIHGGLRSLRSRLSEGYSKWERLSAPGARVQADVDINLLGNPRMIVDNRFSAITDAAAEKQILESMEYLSSNGSFEFTEAILIDKQGMGKRISR